MPTTSNKRDQHERLPSNARDNGHPYTCPGAPDCLYCATITRPTGRKPTLTALSQRRTGR